MMTMATVGDPVGANGSGHLRPSIKENSDYLRSTLQCHDRKVLPRTNLADVDIKLPAATTTNRRLRRCTPGTSRPSGPRLEWRHECSGLELAAHLVRSRAEQTVVRSVFVVPGREQAELVPQGVSRVKGHQSSRALLLDRQDQPFDDSHAAVLADRADPLADASPSTPPSERVISELASLVRDQVTRYCA